MRNNYKDEIWCDIVSKDVSHCLLWCSLGNIMGMLSKMAIEIHIPLKLENLNLSFCQLRWKELLNLPKRRVVIFLFFPIVIYGKVLEWCTCWWLKKQRKLLSALYSLPNKVHYLINLKEHEEINM